VFKNVYSFPFVTDTAPAYFPQGKTPQGPLLQASDGNFYGTTTSGGEDGQCNTPAGFVRACGGTIFQLTPAGKLTVLHTFAFGSVTAPYADGDMPNAGLVEGPDGWLYGTTQFGGTGAGQTVGTGPGVVFRISKTGQFQNLHSRCTGSTCNEGKPLSGLTLGLDGKFYGIAGTPPSHSGNNGSIYRVGPDGTWETLYLLNGFPDGGAPVASLIQASDCNFYGTAASEGTDNSSAGTVFRITRDGTYTPLYSFTVGFGDPRNPGYDPETPLIQATNGNLYGTTRGGGLYAAGTVFELSLMGAFRKIYDLKELDQGLYPNGLLQASDGNLWGSDNDLRQTGSIYALTTGGTLAASSNFDCTQTESGAPIGPLIQATDGKLYGVGAAGGCTNPINGGAIFSIDARLPNPVRPVVSAVTNGASFASGTIVPGEIATIFGSNLTSSTGINLTSSLPLPVSFLNSVVLVNGCAATPLFAVDNVSGQQQINFQAPWELAGQQAAIVQVETDGVLSRPLLVTVAGAQPGIISYSAGGNNFGAILHADYQLADTVHPATAGETMLLYGTGLGTVSAPQHDGNPANGESTIATASVTVGAMLAKVEFSGLAPGFVGLNQVNFDVPAGLTPGNQAVVVSLGGVSSNSVLLPIR